MKKAKDLVIRKILPSVVFLMFSALLVIGTDNDREISEKLYSPGSKFSLVFAVAGIYLFFGLFVFYSGSLFRHNMNSKKGKNDRYTSAGTCILCAVTAAIIGAHALRGRACLGSFMHIEKGIGYLLLTALTAMFPLFILGILLSGKKRDPDAVRELTGIILFMIVVFLVQTVLKHIFVRPRFYLMHMPVNDYVPDVGFEPWYKISADPTELINKYDLQKSDFMSFPSGHTMNAFAGVLAIPVLAYAVPYLRKFKVVFKILAVIIAPCIMVSRIIMGAHYLTDVAFAGMTGVVLCYFYSMIMDYMRDPFGVAKINQKAEDEKIKEEKEREEKYKFWEDC